MSNRFLISVAAAALIAGTGVSNAQNPGRDAGSAGSAAQKRAFIRARWRVVGHNAAR